MSPDKTYCLNRDEPVADGLKRVFLEELNSAGRSLSVKGEKGRDGAIHEARKSVKKMRAILRLVKPHLGDAFSRENEILGSVGRSLSTLRDALVLIETLDDLRGNGLESVRAELVRRKAQAGKPELTLARAMSRLRPLKARVESWKFDVEDFALLESGLRTSYKKGRRALANAKEGNDAVVWHTFRKRVKDHWYHVRLIIDLSGKGLKARKKCLKELEDALGTAHNLVVLRDTIQTDPVLRDTREIATAFDLIDKTENQQHARALRIARGLYDEKPGEFIAGLRHAQRVS